MTRDDASIFRDGEAFAFDLNLVEILCSRLCHDLISPISAINNGLELVGGEGGSSLDQEAMAMISQCGKELAVRLQYLRAALGRGDGLDKLEDFSPLRALAQMYLGDGKVTLVWRDDDLNPRVTVGRKASKLMLSLILLAAEVLPFGGAVVVRMVEGDSGPLVEITATGERIKFDSEVLDALEGTCNINNLEPRTILAYYTGSLGRVIDAQMAIESSEGAVRFGFLLRS
ncbi:MAG: hypothetical protein HOO00_00025 [Rhodospirillaceae bacterium]|jgi:histidine phosphotransferase ChpT|nr:hypothetical protein [Rhodospirillaceae bacterium]MBT5659765.1 hypothetical protein [Rhodospirillaceae bacterium]MBT5753071.1 hypothetical protein [Rhodospirillaceae bacterium]